MHIYKATCVTKYVMEIAVVLQYILDARVIFFKTVVTIRRSTVGGGKNRVRYRRRRRKLL